MKMENLTKDEEHAEGDCVWCQLAKYTDEGDFEKCLSEDNDGGRPLLECQLQQPKYT